MLRVLVLLCTVAAQVYKFDHANIPGNKTLHLVYTFYAYSKADSPVKAAGDPFVRFHNIKISNDNIDYASIQLSVMKQAEFWDIISPYKFCCSSVDVLSGRCERANQLMPTKGKIPLSSVITAKPNNFKVPINDTGVYVLVYSNCGTLNEGELFVDGEVIVHNSYGYLAAVDYHKMPFYGWVALAYLALGLIWCILAFRWRKQLFKVQVGVGIVILFSFLEAFLWWLFFRNWNTNGIRPNVLFVFAIFITVVKNISSYVLVLVAALGWGVTRPDLDVSTIRRIQFVSFVYVILDVIRDVVLSFRHSHFISVSFVLLCLIPVSVVNGIIFYWVFSSLSNLMENLKEHKQTDKLSLYNKFWFVLFFTLVVGTLGLLYQIWTMSKAPETTWMSQWFFTDGLQHILFYFVTVCMFYLWAPSANSHLYSHVYQLDQDGMDAEGTNPEAWANEEDAIVPGEDNENARDARDEETGELQNVEDSEDAPVFVKA